MDNKLPYQSPTVCIVTFRIEQGFTNSLNSAPQDITFNLFADDQQYDYDKASSFGDQQWSW